MYLIIIMLNSSEHNCEVFQDNLKSWCFLKAKLLASDMVILCHVVMREVTMQQQFNIILWTFLIDHLTISAFPVIISFIQDYCSEFTVWFSSRTEMSSPVSCMQQLCAVRAQQIHQKLLAVDLWIELEINKSSLADQYSSHLMLDVKLVDLKQ